MLIIKKLFFVFLFLSATFLLPSKIFAAMSFTVDEIINKPQELSVGEEMQVRVSFNEVSSEKQYYLFLAFRKPESGAYNFGFTQNNDGDWIKYGDSFNSFYKIEIKESSWSGILKIKPDYEASGFKGEGEYQVRAGRYVSSDTPAWTESEDLRIFLKAPSPTPAPTSTPTSEPDPIDTPSPAANSTSTPTIKPTPTPTKKVTPTPIKIATISGTILGEEATIAAFFPLEPTPTATIIPVKPSGKNTWVAKIFLGLGMLALFGAAFSLWYTRLRS